MRVSIALDLVGGLVSETDFFLNLLRRHFLGFISSEHTIRSVVHTDQVRDHHKSGAEGSCVLRIGVIKAGGPFITQRAWRFILHYIFAEFNDVRLVYKPQALMFFFRREHKFERVLRRPADRLIIVVNSSKPCTDYLGQVSCNSFAVRKRNLTLNCMSQLTYSAGVINRGARIDFDLKRQTLLPDCPESCAKTNPGVQELVLHIILTGSRSYVFL